MPNGYGGAHGSYEGEEAHYRRVAETRTKKLEKLLRQASTELQLLVDSHSPNPGSARRDGVVADLVDQIFYALDD